MIAKSPVHILAATAALLFGIVWVGMEPRDNNLLVTGGVMIAVVYSGALLLRLRSLGDRYLFLIAAMLSVVGVAMQFRLNPAYGFKQALWFVLGCLVFFGVGYLWRMFPQRWAAAGFFYAGAIIFLIVVTLVLADELKGSRNWISFGYFNVQPSEMVKFIYVLFLAAWYTNRDNFALRIRGRHVDPIWFLVIVSAMTLLGMALQRELGTGAIIFFTFLAFQFIEKNPWWLRLGSMGVTLAGVVVGARFVPHVRLRVEAWLDPWADVAGKGYQLAQSLFAIGAGGFFGTGIGLGHPHFIPEVRTDFIFSAICEEMGIFGGVAVVMLYFLLVYRGMKTALALHDRFNRLVAFGIAFLLGCQTLIIFGGVTRLLPLTGVTMPFVSYGGSSMLTCFAALGILQALSMAEK